MADSRNRRNLAVVAPMIEHATMVLAQAMKDAANADIANGCVMIKVPINRHRFGSPRVSIERAIHHPTVNDA